MATIGPTLGSFASKHGRRVVSAFIGTALAQDDAEAAGTQRRQVADQLRPRVKKLAELMDEAETDLLAYMSLPPRPGRSCTASLIERLNGEITRRIEVVGIFPNAMTRPSSGSSVPSSWSSMTNGP